MRTRLTWVLAGGALATALLLGSRLAAGVQDPGRQEPGKADPMTAMDPELMARMMELATPGPEHRHLARMVGRWQDQFRFRMAPDAPWMEMQLQTTVTSELGGRFTMSRVRGAFLGMPFEGLQILGYDKMAKEYFSLWMDTQGTWAVQARGRVSEDGKEIVLRGTMKDVAGERPYRQVLRFVDENHTELEMYDTIPPQGEVLVMRARSTRIVE